MAEVARGELYAWKVVWAGRAPAAAAGNARASRMAVRALRLLQRPVSTTSRGRIGLRVPLGAEPIRYFAKRSPTASVPLAFVVGRLGVAALQEHEQLVAAVDIHRVSQLAALGIGWLASEQPLQFPFKTAAMRGGDVGEIGPAAAARLGAELSALASGMPCPARGEPACALD